MEKEKASYVMLKSTADKERQSMAGKRPKSAPAARTRGKPKSEVENQELRQLIAHTTLNYWGEVSASVKRDMRPEYAKVVMAKRNKTQELQNAMKWLLLRELYRTWKKHQRGEPRPGLQNLHEIASLFIVTSEENPLPSVISRDQFLNMLSKKILTDSFDQRMAQKLYTCFDQKNTNRFPWVVIVASIRILLQTYETPLQKLVGVFDIFDQYARGKMTVNNSYAIFILTAGSDEQVHTMKVRPLSLRSFFALSLSWSSFFSP